MLSESNDFRGIPLITYESNVLYLHSHAVIKNPPKSYILHRLMTRCLDKSCDIMK